MKLVATAVVRVLAKDGAPGLALDDRRSFVFDLGKFGVGEEVVVTIESADEHRSNAQNRFFHGPVIDAFASLGLHRQEAKDMLALRFIPTDIHLLDGSIARVPGHTSALTKPQFTDFLEACIQLAAEEGLVIADVEDWRRSQETVS